MGGGRRVSPNVYFRVERVKVVSRKGTAPEAFMERGKIGLPSTAASHRYRVTP